MVNQTPRNSVPDHHDPLKCAGPWATHPPLPGLSSRAEKFDLFFLFWISIVFLIRHLIFSEIAKGQKKEIQAQHHIKSLEDEARGKEGETRRLAPDV